MSEFIKQYPSPKTDDYLHSEQSRLWYSRRDGWMAALEAVKSGKIKDIQRELDRLGAKETA